MQQLTVTIDLSGRTYGSHGPVNEIPNITMTAIGIKTQKDTQLINKIQQAIREIVKPVPVKEA